MPLVGFESSGPFPYTFNFFSAPGSLIGFPEPE
jgi:hypothetical protein